MPLPIALPAIVPTEMAPLVLAIVVPSGLTPPSTEDVAAGSV